MNLTKIIRIAAVSFVAALGFASPSHAAVSAFFSAGANCAGSASASFSTGGPAVPVSLCMTTTTEAACGHTIVLQSAVGESGRFVVTAPVTLGSGYSDPNSEVSQLPLAINNPPLVADFGGTGSTPVAAAPNQLLATFNLAPQASAINASYVISLNSVSIAAVDADGTCGATTVPTEAPITASFTLNRNNAPVFTSATTTTFSTTSANTFIVSATGNPAPAITASTVPAGVTFTPGTGTATLGGTPTVATGSYPITFTATGSTVVTQSFTLVVAGQASQTISFPNPGTQTFSSTPIPLSATATSGLTVAFSSITPAVCTVVGTNVTMVALGTCTINANQAGNATYLAATQVSQSFGIVGGVPGAPVIGAATPGNAQATISFTPPASSGGSVISTYTASCSGISGSANSSPITVTGLTNGVAYSCTVTATNSLGTGPASGSVMVTPAVAPLSLVSVVSRKVHGSAGTYLLPITTGVAINAPSGLSIESRLIGAGHAIVFQFSEAITSSGTVTAVDGASAAVANTVAFTGNEVTVTLTGVADRTRVTVTLANVNGTGAGVTFPVSMGFLAGDQNASYVVDGGDISVIRARSGQAASALNFRGDFNASGAIDGGDISTVRARSGNNLP